MKIKFKNGSTIEVLDNNNETKRGERSQSPYIYFSPCKELLETYGVKLNWYQRWHLRFLNKRLMRWFKRYDK